MADKKNAASAEREAALRALVRQTIDLYGDVDPASIPHRVREKLKSQAAGDFDVEAYAREVLKEQRRKGGA